MAAQAPSRPFRWIGLLLVGWVCFRAVVILAGDPLGGTLEIAPTTIAATQRDAAPVRIALEQAASGRAELGTAIVSAEVRQTSRVTRPNRPLRIFGKAAFTALPISSISSVNGDHSARGLIAGSAARPSPAAGGWTASSPDKRWSASAWLFVRADGPVPLGTASELGGSQAGMRLFYDLVEPVAVTARISRPIARALGGEASVGVALRHGNVGVLVERRIALDRGGRNDFSVTGYGGISEVSLGYGVRLDGYVQAGIVGRDGFADSAMRVERTVATLDKVRISAGGGVWSGIQPGARRLDIGPQLVAQLPIEIGTIRVSAEWRQRVAGNAAPASGPALTMGMDF